MLLELQDAGLCCCFPGILATKGMPLKHMKSFTRRHKSSPTHIPKDAAIQKSLSFCLLFCHVISDADQVAHSTEALKKHEEFLHPDRDKNTPLMFRSPLHTVLFLYLFCPERFDSQTGLDRLNGRRSSVYKSRPTASSHFHK